MFSGIVKGIGRVAGVEEQAGDRRIVVDVRGVVLGELEPGASIAVNGVCLTATEGDRETFAADVSGATLSATTLGALVRGSHVNLEPSLQLGDPLDGHLVSGHVDGLGEVRSIGESAGAWNLRLAAPEALMRMNSFR